MTRLARLSPVSVLLVILVVFASMVAACGGDDTGGPTTSAATTTAATTTEPPSTSSTTSSTVPQTTTSTSTTTATTTTTTEPPSTTSSTVPQTTTTTLPGEPFEGYARAGAVMAVIGVEHDDVLNVRSGPSVSYPVVARLAPTANEAVATGRGRLIPGAIWYELTVGQVTGWSNSRYLAYLGGTSDVTSGVTAKLGEIPSAQTMLELGAIVAGVLKSDDPPSRVTVTVAPSVGDVGEVTYDVVGIGDDSVVGMRLHVFGQPLESGGFSLYSVESTSLCGRGTAGEICV